MDNNKKYQFDTMNVNWEQQRVLSNPLRSRMTALLYEQPMTPKQTADLLGKNPGTVYYHIQQLLKHDIVEVESVQTDKGIVEKYYRAKAMKFHNPEQEKPKGLVDRLSGNVYLSEKLLKQLRDEMNDLFFKYGHLSYQEMDDEEQSPYTIDWLIREYQEEDDE